MYKNAQPMLNRINREWREEDEIIESVAREFSCLVEDVSRDVGSIINELEQQGFVEREVCSTKSGDICSADGVVVEERLDSERSNEKQSAESPLASFYLRNGLMSELHMDLTDGCNERCIHCYIPLSCGTFMPRVMALKILREFRAMEGLTVYMSGGECMLHPDFMDILEEAKRLDLNIVIMTNLTLCDDRMAKFLRELDPQFVNVSVYSMNPAEHDSITQIPGSWVKTMTSICKLKSLGVHVRLATPIMQENKDAVKSLQDFALAMQMHDVVDCDIIGRMDHDCSNQSHALGTHEMETVVRRHRELLCPDKQTAEQCNPDAPVCEVGEFKINVNAHGDFYPCDGGHGIVLGNASKDSLQDVWKGERLNALRTLKNRDFPKCVGCINRPWCKVCVMRNFNETGDMFMPSPSRCVMAQVFRKIAEED